MAGKLYQVRVPAALRARVGKAIETMRFTEPTLGEKWAADKRAEYAEMKAKARLSREAGRVRLAVKKSITFRQAAGGWLKASEASPATAAWYKILVNVHLLPILRDVHVSDIGRARVLDTLDRRKKAGASPDTLRKDLRALKAVLGWARDRGFTVDPSAWAVKRKKVLPMRTRRFDPDQVQAFLDALDGRDRAALEVAASTGMRQGEVRAFRAEWVRWLEGRIHIPADNAWAPKSQKARSAPLTKRLRQVLHGWLDGRTTGLVFPPMTGGEGIYLRGIIQKGRAVAVGTGACSLCKAAAGDACKTSKGADCTPHAVRAQDAGMTIRGMHDFRHHYASMLVVAGEDIRTVQEILGHADITTTRGYMQLRESYLESAGASLDRLSSELSSARKAKRLRLVGRSRSGS